MSTGSIALVVAIIAFLWSWSNSSKAADLESRVMQLEGSVDELEGNVDELESGPG